MPSPFFSEPKKCLNVSPFVAATQSTQTLAWRQSSAGWSLRPIQFVCQTNLTGVPSQGRSWECIKTVTGAWHSLHLGMMSTFDIVRPCPEIIIPQLNSVASCCSSCLWISCTTHLLSNLHLTFISASPSHSLLLFIHLPKFPSILSFSSAHHPSTYPLLLHLLPSIFFLSISL